MPPRVGGVSSTAPISSRPLSGAGSGKQIARGGIQAETGIETHNSIPPLISLVFQAIGSDAEAGHAALMNLQSAGQGVDHRAAMRDPSGQATLTGFQEGFAGFPGGGIAGKTGSGSVPLTFDGLPLEPHWSFRTSRIRESQLAHRLRKPTLSSQQESKKRTGASCLHPTG